MTFEDTVARLSNEGMLLTGDLILDRSITADEISYRKTDFVSQGGIWRGVDVPATISESFSGVLIFGHSDLAISPQVSEMIFKKNPGLKTIWSMNIPNELPNFRALPIGLTNNSVETEFHILFGDQAHIACALEEEPRSEPGIVSSFNWRTSVRDRAWLRFQSKLSPFINWYEPELSVPGRVGYLRAIRKAGFALCPRGNGLDTHRIWETLAVGAIPILLSRHVPGWMKAETTIPRIELENWSQIPSIDLLSLQQSLRSLDPQVLGVDYWWKKIKESAE